MNDNSKMVGPEEAAKIAARMKSFFGPEGPPETKPDDAIAPAQTVQMELTALRARIRTIEVRTTVTAWDALSRQQATGTPDEIERANHARKLGQAALNAAECEKNPCPDGDVEFVSRLTVLMPSGINASDASREDALALIAAERRRHIEVEGWTPEHDAEHANGELAQAGAAYALAEEQRACGVDASVPEANWPWDKSWWKPCPDDRVRELVKAGALIAAEIDRLKRTEGKGNG